MTIQLLQQQQITADLIQAQHALGSSSPKGRTDPSMFKFLKSDAFQVRTSFMSICGDNLMRKM